MGITEYLNEVFASFRAYIDSTGDVCKLCEVTYQSGHVPDYDDKQVQELYILKYSFSYAFEYKRMYDDILKFFDFSDNLNILSLGCGPMTDLWSLKKALQHDCHGIDHTAIEYTGVDCTDWDHKFLSGFPINCRFECQDMIEYLENSDISDTDIFFFPKSICELDNRSMQRLCAAIKNGDLQKRTVALGISLRDQEHNRDIDTEHIERLTEAICRGGYHVIEDKESPDFDWLGIRSYEYDFVYPEEAKEYLEVLQDKCVERDNCKTPCLIASLRSPITTTRYILYRIIIFERDQL